MLNAERVDALVSGTVCVCVCADVGCPDPDGKKSAMDQCYVIDSTVSGVRYTGLDAVINDIIESPSPSNPACP